MPILRPTFIARDFAAITPDLIAPYDMVLADGEVLFGDRDTELDIELAKRFELMERMEIAAGVVINTDGARKQQLVEILRDHMEEDMILSPSPTSAARNLVKKPWPTMILNAMGYGSEGDVLYIDDKLGGIVAANLANTALAAVGISVSIYGGDMNPTTLAAVDSMLVASRGRAGNGLPAVRRQISVPEEMYRRVAGLPVTYEEFPEIARQVTKSAVEKTSFWRTI